MSLFEISVPCLSSIAFMAISPGGYTLYLGGRQTAYPWEASKEMSVAPLVSGSFETGRAVMGTCHGVLLTAAILISGR